MTRGPIPSLPPDTLPETWDWRIAPTGISATTIESLTKELTDAQVRLGRRLFFDPILSDDGSMSCASCHRPDYGFATPDRVSIGVRGKLGHRNVPTVLNRGLGRVQFWDGRVTTLEEQALLPIENADELASSVAAVLERLMADPSYRAEFDAAFGGDSTDHESTSRINATNLAKSLASFQRTLIAANAPVDQFRASQYASLTAEQRAGMWIFESRGKCWQCHSGDNLSDEQFHNTGVSFGTENRDAGRFTVTGLETDRFAMKTPTLRGIAQTAPYMHDGSISTLREVVEFYNQGGSPKDPHLDQRIKPLRLNPQEVDALVSFLEALTPSDPFAR